MYKETLEYMLRYAPIATSTNFPESLKEDFGTTPSTKLTILINNVLVNTTDTGETLASERNDTATPQNIVSAYKGITISL